MKGVGPYGSHRSIFPSLPHQKPNMQKPERIGAVMTLLRNYSNECFRSPELSIVFQTQMLFQTFYFCSCFSPLCLEHLCFCVFFFNLTPIRSFRLSPGHPAFGKPCLLPRAVQGLCSI